MLGTPKGTEVDINGCTVYRFAPNNFSIAVQSESCRDLNNGVIKITAVETMDYTVSIQGDNVDVSTNFTDIREIINLNAGLIQFVLRQQMEQLYMKHIVLILLLPSQIF